MKWRVEISGSAEKFLGEQYLVKEDIFNLIKKALYYFRGEDVNIDIRAHLKNNR